MVRKNELLRFVYQQANMVAKKQESDEYTTDFLVAEATDIIDDLFMSITYENTEGIEKSIEPVAVWSHRSADDTESDWRHMHFSRDEFQKAAERYLKRPWLHYRELDWLIVDALTYADCQASLDAFHSRFMPFSSYILKNVSGIKWQMSSLLWRSIAFSLKWIIWLVLFVAMFRFWPVAPIAWVGITILWQWLRWRAQKRFNNLMATMIATYETLSPNGLNWKTVWDALIKSRGAGVVWDDIVYRLVKERMGAHRINDQTGLNVNI